MILGSVQLVSPYAPGAPSLSTTNLAAVLRQLDAWPSRVTLYARLNLSLCTTYQVLAIGDGKIDLGAALEGTDRNYAAGDFVQLQCNLADVVVTSFAEPTFSAFAITGVSGPLEVGASIAGGSYTFTWSTTNPTNIRSNSILIADTTASTTLAGGLGNTGSDAITLSTITNNSPATQTWTIAATDTQTNAFRRSVSIAWEWRVYAGSSANATLTANQIKALSDSSGLQSGFAGTYSYAAVSGYKFFSYPDSMGDVVSFVDDHTGYPVSMADSTDNAAYSNTANGWSYALVSVTNAQGVSANYRVYRTGVSFSAAFSMRVS